MTSARHNKDFIIDLLPSYPLDKAIEWIKANLSPDDVFDEQNILDYVASTYNANEVFDDRELEGWAEDHGFVKE